MNYTDDFEISELSNFLSDNNIHILDESYNDNTYNKIEYIFENFSPNSAFYIINLGEIIRKIKLWKELFPNIEPRYAVKCNPNKVICQLMNMYDIGFDVASKNEIDLVKDFNNKIVYANPCKEASSIQYARSLFVNTLVVDSEYELYKIKLFHPHAKLLLRLKVDDVGSECRFSEKFGVDLEYAEKIINLAKNMDLNMHGTCFHVGSSCNKPELYKDALNMCKTVFDIAKRNGFDMKLIDIGGGFPGDNDELLKQIATNVNEGLRIFDDNVSVISEPGRFFVKSSHTLLVNIIGKKINKDNIIYYLNDGIYGSFNCIIFDHQNPKIIPYNEENDECEKFNTVIFGPTCDSIDKICDNIQMPEMEIGDWCFVENFGAYTVASSSEFNGFSKIKTYYILN